jgi:hypothetical protein
MPDSSKSDRHPDLAHDDDDEDEPLRLIDVVRAVGRRTRKSPLWGPLELALQVHRAFNKHLLLAQREMFELEIKYVDKLIAADEEAERRDQHTAQATGQRRKKLNVDG